MKYLLLLVLLSGCVNNRKQCEELKKFYGEDAVSLYLPSSWASESSNQCVLRMCNDYMCTPPVTHFLP